MSAIEQATLQICGYISTLPNQQNVIMQDILEEHGPKIYAMLYEANNDDDDSQINRLANFIMAEIKGEPSQDEGAGDCAIRLLRSLN